METSDHLQALRATNARFLDAAAEALLARGWAAAVPSCPDWQLRDLVTHLAQVQHFWSWLVRTRPEDASGYQPPAARSDEELLGFLAARQAALEATLASIRPTERVPTWSGPRDVAWVLRRQTHEVLVHTADVEQVLGAVRPIPPALALDGLDEWLEVMVPAALPDGPPETAVPVVFHAVDADAERTLFADTRPSPGATVTGSAADVLLAVWRRLPVDRLTVHGDAALAAAMLDLVDLG